MGSLLTIPYRERGSRAPDFARHAKDGMVGASFSSFLKPCDADGVTHRKINTSPSTVEDPSVLKTYLTTPPVKRIDLHFPLGIDLTARNMKGVTIKDALDAIHKTYKKRVSSQHGPDCWPRWRDMTG